jgi:hypothetical protein
MKIKVVAFDPSTSAFGCCKASIDIDTLAVTVDDLKLYTTESEAKKGVIKQSDDLRRAKVVREGMLEACAGASLAISEIPFCNPGGYASANFNSGLVTGVLASLELPLIQVFPADVKVAAVGHRHAAKEEIIEWALLKHPDAPWLMRKLKGKLYPTKANEHLADAVAAVYAAMKTEQFKQILSVYRSVAEAKA